jgi:membrane-anchored protein YejM (alkaline phosphatase superfamily)
MKQRLTNHVKLTFYLCLFTAVAVGIFLRDAPVSAGFLPWVYQISIAGYFGTLLLMSSLVLLPFSLYSKTRWLLPLLAWVWLIYLAIDLVVFNLYRFHVDWLIVRMFFLDFHGMGVPTLVLVVAGGLALAMLGGVFWLHGSVRTGSVKRLPLFALGLLFMPAGLAANSVINIWAAYFNREEITSYRPYLPLYYPVEKADSAKEISQWWPAMFPAQPGQSETIATKSSGLVKYPLQDPNCTPKPNPPSILMIVLESWQADSLNAEVMPNLSKFSQHSTRFEKHLSSGAVTVPGLFGLMYGLHPNYFELFKSSPGRNPSLFTETLHQVGYETRVFTSSNLDGFSLRKLFFPHVPEQHIVNDPSDEKLVARYLTSASIPSTKPRFDFLFLTSSHSPYTYPADYARFKPLPAVEGGFALNRQADALPYKNDYYNSLFYLDTLVGQILSAAKKTGALENSWVVITGDHAEEFNENRMGYWGHGSNFTRWQTQTPLLVMSPGQFVAKQEKKLSLHQDIVPTLMQEALGCAAPVNTYSNGLNVFQLPEQRGTIFSSYMTQAYWFDDMVFDRTTNKKYDWRDIKQVRSLDNTEAVRTLLIEERRFLSTAN